MIAFRGFSKTFAGHVAVKRLDLSVGKGEVLALLGPNGSGKTTSLKAAAGLVRPTSGEVLVGDPGRPASDPEARRCLSFLPQRVAFPDALSGEEVVRFHSLIRNGRPERAREALAGASLNGAVVRAVSTYSGGMLQRLGLAVALLPEAPVFLLDEPTAALDPDGLESFYKVIGRAREDGRAVLFTSHQMGDAERLADRFAILVGGRLVADIGAREMRDLLAQRGRMRLRVPTLDEAGLEGLRLVAPGATLSDGELLVPGVASLRPRVIEKLSSLGHRIDDLVAEEGRLDDLYRELVASGAGAPS